MRRFLLTSEKFTGQVELLYDNNAKGLNLLKKIDFTGCTCSGSQVAKLKEAVPIVAETIDLAFDGMPITIVEADFTVTFDMFWEAYNNKVNRKRAFSLWEKMQKAKQVLAFSSIKAYDTYLKREEWRKKQDPDTYLRNETFENEWNTKTR